MDLHMRERCETTKTKAKDVYCTIMTSPLPVWRVQFSLSQEANKKRKKICLSWMTGRLSSRWRSSSSSTSWLMDRHCHDAHHELNGQKFRPLIRDSSKVIPLISPLLLHDLRHPNTNFDTINRTFQFRKYHSSLILFLSQKKYSL